MPFQSSFDISDQIHFENDECFTRITKEKMIDFTSLLIATKNDVKQVLENNDDLVIASNYLQAYLSNGKNAKCFDMVDTCCGGSRKGNFFGIGIDSPNVTDIEIVNSEPRKACLCDDRMFREDQKHFYRVLPDGQIDNILGNFGVTLLEDYILAESPNEHRGRIFEKDDTGKIIPLAPIPSKLNPQISKISKRKVKRALH